MPVLVPILAYFRRLDVSGKTRLSESEMYIFKPFYLSLPFLSYGALVGTPEWYFLNLLLNLILNPNLS
jgi:hypothetical protein